MVQGNSRKINNFTVNHHVRDEDGQAELRLDAVLDLVEGTMKTLSDTDRRGDYGDGYDGRSNSNTRVGCSSDGDAEG